MKRAYTARVDPEIADRIDALQREHGLTQNGAMNMIIRAGLARLTTGITKVKEEGK